MSESVEKKVLKEMLVKLKAKLIESQRMFVTLSMAMSSSSVQDLKSALETTLKMPEGQPKTYALLLIAYLNTWGSNVNMVNITTASLMQDMNLYIETLERYSTELDSTLNSIFERAIESARKTEEEQRRQQEELSKRKPDYTA
jgi:hypothetical protein